MDLEKTLKIDRDVADEPGEEHGENRRLLHGLALHREARFRRGGIPRLHKRAARMHGDRGRLRQLGKTLAALEGRSAEMDKKQFDKL